MNYWFQDLAYNFFANNDICMVWSQLARMSTPPIVTTDFLYVRFIGDRTIDEKDFGKIQKDRVLEMKRWANEIKNVENKKERGRRKEVNLAMIATNNHYAGFGPGTSNLFRKMLAFQNYPGKIGTNYKNDLNYESDNYSSWNKINKLETLRKCLQEY